MTPAQKQKRYRGRLASKVKRDRRTEREQTLAAATLQSRQQLGAMVFPVSMSIGRGGSSPIRASPGSIGRPTTTTQQ
jgi:hypothetical protein